MDKRSKNSVIRMLGLLILVATFLLYVGDAHAQFGSASVLGYVRDNSGAVVPNAVVKLSNIATDVSLTARTDNDGKYEFNSVPIRSQPKLPVFEERRPTLSTSRLIRASELIFRSSQAR